MKRKLTNKDYPILMQLFLWKFLPTSALAVMFFAKQKPRHAYYHLRKLKRLRYITEVPFRDHGGAAWILTKKGFKTILPKLPRLTEEGFKSEALEHDLLVNAIHLGEWLMSKPEGSDILTEQQLRRYHSCSFPDWIPTNYMSGQPIGHRPDGYWKIPIQNETRNVIALEAEFKLKTADEYDAVAYNYASSPQIRAVVWVTELKSHGHKIQNFLETSRPQSIAIHSFLLLADFKRLGWNCPFYLGSNTGLSLRSVLTARGQHSGNTCGPAILLDTRKSPVISTETKILNGHVDLR